MTKRSRSCSQFRSVSLVGQNPYNLIRRRQSEVGAWWYRAARHQEKYERNCFFFYSQWTSLINAMTHFLFDRPAWTSVCSGSHFQVEQNFVPKRWVRKQISGQTNPFAFISQVKVTPLYTLYTSSKRASTKFSCDYGKKLECILLTSYWCF